MYMCISTISVHTSTYMYCVLINQQLVPIFRDILYGEMEAFQAVIVREYTTRHGDCLCLSMYTYMDVYTCIYNMCTEWQ